MSGQAKEKLDAYMRETGDIGAGPTGPLDWSIDLTEAEFDRITDIWNAYSPLDESELQPRTPSRGAHWVPFQSIMFECRPDYLKRHRLHANLLLVGRGLSEPIPASTAVWTVVWGHWYTASGDAVRATVDIAAARRAGATKSEISQWLALGQFQGHNWFNTTASIAERYMRAWDANDGAPGLQWPEGWRSDPDVFRCGINFLDYDEDKLDEEVELIRDWYRRWQGEVPKFVDFFGKHWPLALRALRGRYETATDGPLPSQMVVLLELDVALKRTRPDAVRRALHMARALGVTKDQVVQELAFTQLPLGHDSMDAALVGVENILDDWDAGNGRTAPASSGGLVE